MSEKNALRLEEGIRSPAEPPTSRSPHQARRRARQYKAACFYFSLVMANNMHKYAIANTPKAQQTRWNELIAPVNAHLSPWILLFSSPLPGPSRPSFLGTTTFFIAAIFSYIVYARLYYQWNQQNDRYQLPVLVVAALAGLIPALSLNIGFLISIFCVTPKVALFGLLVSDILHLVVQGPWQENEAKEQTMDVEKGLQSNANTCENVEDYVIVAEQDMQSDADAHQQAAIVWYRPGEERRERILLRAKSSTESVIEAIATNCEEIHQASSNISSEDNGSCNCLAQVCSLQGSIAKLQHHQGPDADQVVSEYEKAQEFEAILKTAVEAGLFRPLVASPHGQPRLRENVEPECEQPCCWHLGPSGNTTDNA